MSDPKMLGPRERVVLALARSELSTTEPRRFTLLAIACQAMGKRPSEARPLYGHASRIRRRLVELGYLRRDDDGYLLAG